MKALRMQNNKVLGIVAEYNPLHKGHIYQMEKCKAAIGADFTIVVISGNFTQRGEAAIIDKWSRSKAAVIGGADLVVELPFYYACNSAEYFAKGAVEILNATGVVTHLGFGSESGNIEDIKEAANMFLNETQEVSSKIKEYLEKGIGYPEAISKGFGYNGNVSFEPNNILAIEYVKAIKKLESNIVPVTVKRHKTGYHEASFSEGFASASGIREAAKNQRDLFLKLMGKEESPIDDFVINILEEEKKHLVFSENEILFKLLQGKVLSSSSDELRDIFSVGEGLENKMKKEIRYAKDFEDFVNKVASKRYPKNRIRRMFTHVITGFKKDAAKPEYIRILAFNNKGAELLKLMKKSDNLAMPIITNINKQRPENIEMDIKAADIYNLISGRDLYKCSDYVKMPEIVEQKCIKCVD